MKFSIASMPWTIISAPRTEKEFDMESINRSRRNAVWMLMATPALLLMPSAVLSKEPEAITVDVSGVTDVPSLILAIKKAAGNLLPASIKDEVFHAELAKIFVENAHAAAEHGFHIPQWILDKLPNRKVFFVIPLVLGVAVLMINGVPFRVAVKTIISAVLASIVLMATAISAAIHSAAKNGVVI